MRYGALQLLHLEYFTVLQNDVCQIMRFFESRLLRKILWPKREEATGDWRRVCNKELYDLCSQKYY